MIVAYGQLDQFAFFEELRDRLAGLGHDLAELRRRADYQPILETFLGTSGLNYGNSPKGLLSFHRYSDAPRTPVEEHFQEAVAYARGGEGTARAHFTVSEEYLEDFRTFVAERSAQFQQDGRLEVGFSIQKEATDTIAVDLENKPFRDRSGELVFRPGGHGALIENLGELDGDLVFVKNIDNVVPDHLKPETVYYKKLLGGYLVALKRSAGEHLNTLARQDLARDQFDSAVSFVAHMGTRLSADVLRDRQRAVPLLRELLDRPIRVCGMVKNQGEPGGGPFWVGGPLGETLQIVESSQIDQADPHQMGILRSSTHFNPVDLVCSVKDHDGSNYDLSRFVDKNACFISHKSKDGKPLKALELPGLWNGAMAGWNTVFIEVPLITFNPVKTVNDLLRPEHLPC